MTVDAGSTLDNIAPGSLVVVRDEEWLVTQVSRNRDGLLLTVEGLSELVAGTTAQFSSGLDTIDVADPSMTKVVADGSPGYRRARLWLEATLRKTPLPIGDPTLAVADQMLLDTLEYQRTAVRKALDPEILRPRILLADAVGLGKTLEIGMILAELARRGRGDRILIVTPRHVLEQMQQEMWTRFALPFVRLDSLGIQQVRRRLPASRNPFSVYKRAIISIDTLKNDRYLAHLRKHRWDAVVIDESHNITGSATQNNRLATVLAPQTDALILASATPHNGRTTSFAELMRLLEPTSVGPDGEIDHADVKRLVVRRHRHSPEVAEVVGADWAERLEPANRLVGASAEEDEIAEELAAHWLYDSTGRKGGEALFGWTLAKAFLSSPAALAESCRKRLARTEDLRTADRDSLMHLLELAAKAQTNSGKYAGLVEQLDRIGIRKDSSERVVIFAERVATLHWLRERIMRDRKLSGDQVRVMHGGLSDIEQQDLVDSFKQENSPIRVLVTGDVASEGVNLHRQCHELIHFDIPWSLIRIEQRNGRIDRYGQKFHPQITTLLLQTGNDRFAGDVRVLRSLMEKEHEAHSALGDTASIMGQYDVAAEEKQILAVLRGRKQLDEVLSTPDHVIQSGDLAALLAQLDGPSDSVGGQPETVSASSGSGLYAAPIDFLREAVAEIYPRPDQQPLPGVGGGVGWVEHQGEHIVDITPPNDLKARLRSLPQSYLREREVTTRFRLATSRAKGDQLLAEALRDDQRSSWPAAHFLGPLHPVLDWVSDRTLATLSRGEVFAVRGTTDTTSVLLNGTLTNRAGQTVSSAWLQVRFEPDSPLAMVELHPSAAALLRAVGMTSAMSNPGAVDGLEELSDLIPRAVRQAEKYLEQTFTSAAREAERQVEGWASRASGWAEEADALLQRNDLRQRRLGVQEQERLAEQRRPERRNLRPLLVVVPTDQPAAPRAEGA